MLVSRVSLRMEVGKDVEVIHSNNPTAMTLVALHKSLSADPTVDSILEARGVPALVRLLKESTCPHITSFTTMTITLMLDAKNRRPGRVADRFFKSGEWRHMAICQA